MKKNIIISLFITVFCLITTGQDSVKGKTDDNIIAIPVKEGNPDAQMDESFSRCAWFCLYNTKTGETRFIKNAQQDATGGASRQTIEFLRDQGVREVYANKVGQNAQRHLDRLSIKLVTVDATKRLRDVLEKVKL